MAVVFVVPAVAPQEAVALVFFLPVRAVIVSLLSKGPGAEVEALFDKASKPEA